MKFDSMRLNRRTILKGIAGAGAAMPLTWAGARAAAEGKDLKGSGSVVVFDGGGVWGAAQKKEFFKPFEELTGISVIPNAQAPVSKIRASITAGAPAFDVICLPGADMASLQRDGMLEELDFSYFTEEELAEIQPVKPLTYCVPALFYSLVLACNTDATGGKVPTGWKDLLNFDEFPGKRAFYNAADGIVAGAAFEVALLADGVAPEQLYPLDLERAIGVIDRMKDHILKFWTTGGESAQLLTDGAVSLSASWNSRVKDLKTKGVPVDLTWNQGIMQWDGWGVPKGTKNRDNAMKFIAFASRADRQAPFTEATWNGPSNFKAFDTISKEVAEDLPTKPDFAKLQVAQNYDWWSAVNENGKSNEAIAAELWQKWVTK